MHSFEPNKQPHSQQIEIKSTVEQNKYYRCGVKHIALL